MRSSRSVIVAAAIAGPLLSSAAICLRSADRGRRLRERGAHYGLTTPALIRRGVTSRVRVVKDLVDLVPFDQISVDGETITSLTNGRTSSGTGFVQFDITIKATIVTGATSTLRVGLLDRFSLRTVGQGQVASITKSPDPATLQAGTPWVATIQGIDLGNVVVIPIACHTVTYANRTSTSVQATLTRTAGCTSGARYNFSLALGIAGDPPTFPMTNGASSAFEFEYRPPPICHPAANIGQPVFTFPQNGQVLAGPGGLMGSLVPQPPPTSGTISTSVAWNPNTTTNVAAPNNEWLFTLRTISTDTSLMAAGAGARAAAPIPTAQPPSVVLPITVVGTSRPVSFAVPGTYSVTLTAKNCGQPAPSTTIRFSTAFR